MYVEEKRLGEAREDINLRIIDWLRTQPADLSYDWHDDRNCPCARFGGRDVWRHLDTLAGYKPWTYGALLNRALAKENRNVR